MSKTDLDTQQRVPDFFIVGHQKCGTTALYLMLRDHPQVFMPDVKEPRYFASDLRSRFPPANPSPNRPRTLDAYLALFSNANAHQLAGEASPHYLRSSVAARDIAALQPAARIIAILREPANYLRSFHLQMVSSREETQRDFRKAIALEPSRREGKNIPRACHHPASLLYSDHVRYTQQLQRFHQAFPREQVLVLAYEDFRRDNNATLRQVQRFLDIDDTHPIQTLNTNRVNAVRSPLLHQLLNAGRRARINPNTATPAQRVVNALSPGFMRNDVFRSRWRRLIYAPPPPPDEQLMRELRNRFAPEVKALSQYLHRDFLTLWGYPTSD